MAIPVGGCRRDSEGEMNYGKMHRHFPNAQQSVKGDAEQKARLLSDMGRMGRGGSSQAASNPDQNKASPHLHLGPSRETHCSPGTDPHLVMQGGNRDPQGILELNVSGRRLTAVGSPLEHSGVPQHPNDEQLVPRRAQGLLP